MRSSQLAVFFVFALAFGMWVNDHSWNGQLFVYVGEERAPASVRSLTDYSTLDRKALGRSVHAQLMADAQIVQKDGDVGVQLGHPLVDRKGGGKEFGCQVQDHSGVYDRMEMVFTGVGVMDDGEVPRMTVESICQSQSDLNKLETVWIPMKEIMVARTKDQLFQTGGDSPVSVHLESIPDQWPQSWVLISVKLYRDGSGPEPLLLDASLLKQARSKLLSFDLQK